MNLKDWVALNKHSREKFELECYCTGRQRQIGELAEAAAEALKKKLVQHSQVFAVTAGEDSVTKRPIIMIATSLRHGELLSGIPDEFAGFPVVQYGIAQKKMDYLKRLEFVLRAANLPQAELDMWLKHFDRELSNLGSVFYAETPGRWIAEALIKGAVKGSLTGTSRVELRGELWAAITDFFKEADPAKIGFNPQQMSRLRGVLQTSFAKHGISI